MFQLVYPLLLAINSATILNNIYIRDTTLSKEYNPYYVNEDVTFNLDTTLSIEPGVEIIFNGDYELNVRGVLNACPDSTMTSRILTRGVYNASTAITFTSSPNHTQVGYISLGTKSVFCNVYFRDMHHATSYGDEVSIYNAEFSYLSDNIFISGGITVYDSVFHHFTTVSGYGRDGKFFYNCLFTNFTLAVLYVVSPYSIFDSHIYGNYDANTSSNPNIQPDQACVWTGSVGISTVQNTTIANCEIALKISGSQIYNNKIINNYYAIQLWKGINDYDIKYNNLIGNKVLATTEFDYDTDLSYNYFGTNDAMSISNKIYDRCNDTWENLGLIKFYPYFIEPLTENIDIDITNGSGPSLPETETISWFIYEMYCTIADAPTSDPTEEPTFLPSVSPTTTEPTEMPITSQPTSAPTPLPSAMPTETSVVNTSKSAVIKIAFSVIFGAIIMVNAQ